jgi:hypothetical protein
MEYQEIMKNGVKIFLLFTLIILLSRNTGYAQEYIAQADTSRINRERKESMEKSVENEPGENRQQASKGRPDNQQPAKTVKSARPDMSKARGARPAYIQRQSGSGIPRGIGKPAGAGAVKPGKR